MIMNLDEAILHAEEVAENQESDWRSCPRSEQEPKCSGYNTCMISKNEGCLECAAEHRQLAKWLKDYKRLLEKEQKTKDNEKMTFAEAREVFINRGWIKVKGGKVYDGNKWRDACNIISEWLEQESCIEAESQMRDATPEENKMIEDYVESISKPTGVNFWALKQESCKDAVSRQMVKEQMIKYGFLAPDMTVTEFVEDLSPVNLKESKWTPVSKKLPRKSGKYWCTFKDTFGETYLTGSCFYTTKEDAKNNPFYDLEECTGWNSQNVIAWMPLPESYKTESDKIN